MRKYKYKGGARSIRWWNDHPPIDAESVPDSDTPCPECGSLKVVPVFVRTLWHGATAEERKLAEAKLAILEQSYVTAHYGNDPRDGHECLGCGYRWFEPRPTVNYFPDGPGPDDPSKFWK